MENPINHPNQPVNNSEEKNWGMFCHLAALAGYIIPFGNIIGPIIVWSMKKDEFSFVEDQGKESINFQLSMIIYFIISAILVLVGIGILLLIALGIFQLIIIIVAAMSANNGTAYRYPLNMRLIH